MPPTPPPDAGRVRHARKVARALARLYPDARCALDHRNPFELLVATILSAQCTDRRVNMVTPALFGRFPTPADLARGTAEEVESIVRPTGFYRNKARNLVAAASAIVERHGGAVPADLDALTALPGVGRKTAHVVLGDGFGIASGVVVDTHVGRLSRRLGMTGAVDPAKVEADLNAAIPRSGWVDLSHRLIDHGRGVCDALRPRCRECPLASLCPKVGVAEKFTSPIAPAAPRLVGSSPQAPPPAPRRRGRAPADDREP